MPVRTRSQSFLATNEGDRSGNTSTAESNEPALPGDRHCTAVPPNDTVLHGSSPRSSLDSAIPNEGASNLARPEFENAKRLLSQQLRLHGLDLFDPLPPNDSNGQRLCLMLSLIHASAAAEIDCTRDPNQLRRELCN